MGTTLAFDYFHSAITNCPCKFMLAPSSSVSARPQINSLLPVSVYSEFTAPLIYSTLVLPVSCLEITSGPPWGRESRCHSQGKQTDTIGKQQTQHFWSAGNYQRPLRGEGGKSFEG